MNTIKRADLELSIKNINLDKKSFDGNVTAECPFCGLRRDITGSFSFYDVYEYTCLDCGETYLVDISDEEIN